MAEGELLTIADELYGLPLRRLHAGPRRAGQGAQGATRPCRARGEGAEEALAGRLGGQPAGPARGRAGRPGARPSGRRCGRRRPASTGDELRALTRQRRQLTAAVTTRARGVAADEGVRVTQAVADQVEATLTAAMLDARRRRRGAQRAAGRGPGGDRGGRGRRGRGGGGAGGARLRAPARARPRAVPAARPARRTRPGARTRSAREAAEEALAGRGGVEEATEALEAAEAAVATLEARGAPGPGRDRRAAQQARRARGGGRGDRRGARRRRGRAAAEAEPRPWRTARDAGCATCRGRAATLEELSGSDLRPSPSSARRRRSSGGGRRRRCARSPAGSKRRSSCQVSRRSSVEDQTPAPRPARNAAPRRGGLDDLRPLDGYADLVGLDLAEQVVGGRAAVDPQRAVPAPVGIVSSTSRTSNAIASSVARTMWRAGGAAGEPDDQAARVRVPVRGAEPGQRGHEDHALGVRRRSPRSRRSRPRSRRSAARRAATARPRRSRRSRPRWRR